MAIGVNEGESTLRLFLELDIKEWSALGLVGKRPRRFLEGLNGPLESMTGF